MNKKQGRPVPWENLQCTVEIALRKASKPWPRRHLPPITTA